MQQTHLINSPSQTPAKKPEITLREKLMSLASVAVIAMAVAPTAEAQNDVDGYDGLVYSGCPNGAITAGETARRHNMVAGMRHCISTGADRNIISGGYHTVGSNSDINTISGWRHTVGQTSIANLINGNRNTLGDSSWHNTLSGYQIIAAGNGNWANALMGDRITLGSSSSYNSVTGSRQTLGTGNRANDMSGRSNSMGDLVRYNSMTGRQNVIGNAETGNQDLTGTANHVSGAFNGVGVIRSAGADGFMNTQDDILSAPANFFTGAGNDVSGRYNTLGASSNNNQVGGRNQNIGNFSSGNSVAGYGQSIGNLSNYNHVSGGFFNRMDNNTSQVSILGSNNYTGAFTSNVQIMGRNNDLCNDTDTGAGISCAAGGTSSSDIKQSINVLGSNNKVYTVGLNGSHVKILGNNNFVDGADSGWNVITGHNALVRGAGNFVAGGNASGGATIVGANNVAVGVDTNIRANDGVAIGVGAEVKGDSSVALGSCEDINANGSFEVGECTQSLGRAAAAVGTGAQANGDFSFAAGTSANAAGDFSVAIGPRAEAIGPQSTAFGMRASATGGSSLAIGKNTSAGHFNSSAFGVGATTTLTHQMMFGMTSTSYVMPGITSFRSRSRQVGPVYYVTSDANGNLAVTNDPVPVPSSSSTSSSDSPVTTGSGKITAPANASASSSASRQTQPAEGPYRGSSPDNGELVDSNLVGSNLNFNREPASIAVPGFSNANSPFLSEARSLAAVNAEAIEVNRQEITRNTIKIDQAFSRIASNTDAIEANALRLTDMEEGLAAVAALPDMYLNPDEAWAAGGSVAVFGDQVGVGGTLTIRGSDNWSFGASAGMGGDEATGKIQFRYSGSRF